MVLEIPERKKGRPRKWVNTTQRTFEMGAADLEVLTNAAKSIGMSLNSFVINSALEQAHELGHRSNTTTTATTN